MKRIDGWHRALAVAIRARAKQKFEYGTFDCSLAAADCVLAMTGIDLMADFRGQYNSAASAAVALNKIGKPTLLKTLISLVPKHGGKRIPVHHACKGDLVVTKKALHDAVQGQAVGVWLDSAAIFPGETGWVHVSRTDLIAAFKIG